jgi:glycosyltransferase involved in cell wall biosynthesis
MDSSLLDLEAKGVLTTAPDIYNPDNAYERVFHFTPHAHDLSLADLFAPRGIVLVHHPAVWLSPARVWRAFRLVHQMIASENIRLVRGRLPYLGSLVGGMAARLRRIPFVVSLGGDNRIVQERNKKYNYNSRIISYGMEWLVLKLANKIIVPNAFTRRYVARIIGQGGASKCVHIPWLSTPVPDSGDDDAATLKRLNLPNDAALVPIVGFLNRYKYTDVLFEALDGMSVETADGRPVCFCFCGDGPLKAAGQARFVGRDDVRFPGWQDNAVVHALLRRAELALIPMSGFVLLEAASIGTPVITSNVEWHGEMVEDGRSGLIVQPTDPAAWRGAIREMLSNGKKAAEMGRRLKDLYWRDYTPRQCKDAEIALYRNLIDGSGRS